MTKKKAQPEGVKAFVIDRSKWLNGTIIDRYSDAADDTALRTEYDTSIDDVGDSVKPESGSLLHEFSGRMCCLGFYTLACGVPVKHLAGRDLPSSLPPSIVKKFLPEFLVYARYPAGNVPGASDVADALASANDGEARPKEREAKITKLFADVGVTVTFTGKYPTVAQLRTELKTALKEIDHV